MRCVPRQIRRRGVAQLSDPTARVQSDTLEPGLPPRAGEGLPFAREAVRHSVCDNHSERYISYAQSVISMRASLAQVVAQFLLVSSEIFGGQELGIDLVQVEMSSACERPRCWVMRCAWECALFVRFSM